MVSVGFPSNKFGCERAINTLLVDAWLNKGQANQPQPQATLRQANTRALTRTASLTQWGR